MDLDDIRSYAHKIKKIYVTNNNQESSYNYIVIKIHLETASNEVVRFSIMEDGECRFIDHQFANDYYCYIPNKVNKTMILYAHFFPSDLYTYDTELTDLVYIYDFQNLTDDNITCNLYDREINTDKELEVHTLAEYDEYASYDPNYKNYITTYNDNETEQGMFPLSSKYRQFQNWLPPNFADDNPYWMQTDDDDTPFWEALIDITKIPELSEMSMPINIFLNYQYLPTSREYHQHYYGLQSNNNNIINVFEGTNINRLDSHFGSNNNYRLINLNNPYDDSKSFFVEHQYEKDLNLINAQPHRINNKQTCKWQKNECKNYYVYTSFNSDNNYCIYPISLQENHTYSLKYYIYIPSTIQTNDDSCYISIITDDNEYKIRHDFLSQDKIMLDQWIYHEVPFEATENVLLKIVGPDYHENNDNKIYFTNIKLYEETEYAPILQYTKYNVNLLEDNKKIQKSLSDTSATVRYKSNERWNRTNNTLPSIYADIQITVDSRNNIIDNDAIVGVKGENNTFVFSCINKNNSEIQGTIRAGIFLTNDNSFDLSDSVKSLISQPKNIENNKIIFDKIDLSNLNGDGPFFIKIEYIDPCYSDNKIFIQKISLLKEEINIDSVTINGRTINNNQITIDNINDFPLQIKGRILDQNNNPKTDGYCELSINDKVNQSTIIDDNGWFDFYLTPNDLANDCYTIKIEYYRQYNRSLTSTFFDICVSEIIYEKDVVLVDINVLNNNELTIINNNEYTVNKDDCTLFNIDTKKCSKFRLEVYRDNVPIIQQNIYNKNDNPFYFINAILGDYDTHTYLIKTGNMYDDNNEIIEDLYQTYERTFTIHQT